MRFNRSVLLWRLHVGAFSFRQVHLAVKEKTSTNTSVLVVVFLGRLFHVKDTLKYIDLAP